jgi:hypothetical protein
MNTMQRDFATHIRKQFIANTRPKLSFLDKSLSAGKRWALFLCSVQEV